MKLIAVLTAAIVALTNSATAIVSPYEIPYYEYVNDYEEPVEDYVCCTVDATGVSLGEIIPTTQIPFDGENCAEIFVTLLEQEGYTPIYSGTTDEWFYLSAIEGIDTSQISVPDDLKAYLAENGVDCTESVSVDGTLGEFDITNAAGWVFTVNGELPSVGMCDYVPEIGDEIRLSFTLYYGEDIIK